MSRRLLPYGQCAVLLECADLEEVLALTVALRAEGPHQVNEVVPGARTVLVRLSEPLTPQVATALAGVEVSRVDRSDDETVTIDVAYDGDDLDEVAHRCGLSAEEVVTAHAGQPWLVGFCGFAPGFAYLHGTDDRLRVPRRATPRTKIPAGSVALADGWSGIYPQVSPGGWQLIGRTDAVLWDLSQDPPALLQPGMQVQFRPLA